jgi:hypothetical protein
MVKEINFGSSLGDISQMSTMLLPLGSFQRSSTILKPIFFFVLLTLENLKSFDIVPRKNLWNRLEVINVSLELRDVTIRMYENVIPNLKNTEGW